MPKGREPFAVLAARARHLNGTDVDRIMVKTLASYGAEGIDTTTGRLVVKCSCESGLFLVPPEWVAAGTAPRCGLTDCT